MSGDYEQIEKLRDEYNEIKARLTSFANELTRQIDTLLQQNEIPLGVPLQSRVKEWDSIQAKLERKPRELKSITQLTDLIGLRIALLFQRDVDAVCDILNSNFQVREQEDTGGRLEANQFDYLS